MQLLAFGEGEENKQQQLRDLLEVVLADEPYLLVNFIKSMN
nr:MAG TPA: hypothetical protein [Caudoviricetes sp.]